MAGNAPIPGWQTRWARFVMTLMIGGVGGWLFAWAQLPLPWMLGSMTAVTLATLVAVPVHAPPRIRAPMTAIIGVLLGSAFHPELIGQLAGWVPSLLGLLVFSAIAGFACSVYLLRVARLDPVTAYFAGMPGGLLEMIEMGREKGGDDMTIALMHAARILMIVSTIPFLVYLVDGTVIGTQPAIGRPITEATLSTFIQLLACAIAGAVLGQVARLPAKFLLGPMLVSAFFHVVGLTTFVPPTEIVNGAQLVLGAVLGSRFAAATPLKILRILMIAAGMTLVLLCVVTVCTMVMTRLTGIGVATLILAYAPGGLTEMGLVALAINADVAFVASHHLFRVVTVMLVAGPAYRLLGRLKGDGGPPR